MAAEVDRVYAELDAKIAECMDIETLQALLEGRGLIEVGDDGSRVVVVEDEGAGCKRKPLRSIVETAAGDKDKERALAEWLLRKHEAALEEFENHNSFVAAQARQLQDFLDERLKAAQSTVGWVDGLLQDWHDAAHGGDNSVKLFGGTLAYTKKRAKKVWDDAKALVWALAQADAALLVEIKRTPINERILKTEDGDYADAETGELVDFVRDVPPSELGEPEQTWSVKPAK